MHIPHRTARVGGRAKPRSVPSSSITVTRPEAAVVVTVQGTLDADGAQQLRRILKDLVENQGNLNVEVDLAGVKAMSSATLAALLEAATQAGDRGGQLLLRNPREGVLDPSTVQPDVPNTGPRARRLFAQAWHPAAAPRRTGEWPPRHEGGETNR